MPPPKGSLSEAQEFRRALPSGHVCSPKPKTTKTQKPKNLNAHFGAEPCFFVLQLQSGQKVLRTRVGEGRGGEQLTQLLPKE